MTNWRTSMSAFGLAILLVSCATTGASPKPVHDFRSIAGNWEGTVMTHRGPQPLTIVIDPDGKVVASTAQGRISWTTQLKDGKILYRTDQGASGSMILYDESRGPVFKGSRHDGTFPFELRPAK